MSQGNAAFILLSDNIFDYGHDVTTAIFDAQRRTFSGTVIKSEDELNRGIQDLAPKSTEETGAVRCLSLNDEKIRISELQKFPLLDSLRSLEE